MGLKILEFLIQNLKVDRSERIGLIDHEEMEFDYKSTGNNAQNSSGVYPPISRNKLIHTSSEESEGGEFW